jgi:sucrose phosphorylase
MTIKNQIVLVTYPDSLGSDLKELNSILKEYFQGVVGGVHILPFFPSSADRGFAPLTYEKVDPAFGTWDDIRRLGENFYLIFDFMVNHISRSSEYFQDFLQKKDESQYAKMFIRYQEFWPEGAPTQADIDLIFKRKPRAPYVEAEFADGTAEKIWCTFAEEQIDLNLKSEVTRKFVVDTLINLVKHDASVIRLDAFAYGTKKVGTNCFFVEPEVWELLDGVRSILETYGVTVLPELHNHYTKRLQLAQKDYWVYDFALPMLLLYSLYTGSNQRLLNWLRQCPRKQFTTLDTHDGIGVVDVVDLLSPDEIELTKEYLFARGANVKKIYNTTAYQNLDIYQLNCTYYSALGNDDDAYILARAIQFFVPGIPQVYYVGLLAGENDIELLEETKIGRNINRHYYNRAEIETNLGRPVLKRLYNLMRFRNFYPAFDGDYQVSDSGNSQQLEISWRQDRFVAVLQANLHDHTFGITYFDPATGQIKQLEEV